MSFWKTELGKDIFETKYAGKFAGDPEGFYRSMAHTFAYGDTGLESKFYDMLVNGKFAPGGRIMAYIGRPESKVSLMNCTTHEVEADTLEAITDTVGFLMRASSRGQGIGMNLSKLRPRGSSVDNSAKSSTGAISFMEMLDKVGGTIGQEGRRGAMLFSMRVNHPDIWRHGKNDVLCPKCAGKGCMLCKGIGYLPYDFLTIKRIPGKVENANISVLVSDAFMKAVENDTEWELRFDGKSGDKDFTVSETVQARDLFKALATNAWQSAEPGLLFEDTIRRMSNSDLLGERWKVVGQNACAEMMLDQDSLCNLASINLSQYVQDPYTDRAYFRYGDMASDTYFAIKFLDNVIRKELEEKRYISKKQMESLINLRRVGLGVMGFGDALAMMGLNYAPDHATKNFIDTVFKTMRDEAYKASISIASTQGSCKAWQDLSQAEKRAALEGGFLATLPDRLKDNIYFHGLRNITLLSVAPTGSISNLWGVTSGVEPLFAREYTRRVRMSGDDKFVKYFHPGVEQAMQAGRESSLYQTAYETKPEDNVYIQGMIQQYVDSAISKTINLPEDASVADIQKVYMLAWTMGLKGTTVYRDYSRQVQVLYTEKSNEGTCPSCGGKLIYQGGCEECPSCGYGKCS